MEILLIQKLNFSFSFKCHESEPVQLDPAGGVTNQHPVGLEVDEECWGGSPPDVLF